ncbi:MAG: metallopeptidase TldD-related protein, partial [Bacteroidota bacterium]
MKLSKIICFVLLIAIAPAGALFGQKIDDDQLMKAMRDELKRNINNLQLEFVQAPYYIEYRLNITDAHTLRAELGSIVDSSIRRQAELTVSVRVGDYKFDNSNFFDVGLSFFGSGDQEESFKNRRVPIELDYETLRRELWLATDAAYKQAAEIYSKKEAAMKNKMRKDTTHDFMQVEPQVGRYVKDAPEMNVNYWAALMKRATGIFAEYSDIHKSMGVMEYLPERKYFINSEGMEYIKTKLYTGFEIIAATQAEDGMPIADFFTSYGETPDDLPERDSLMSGAKSVAEKVMNLRKAPELEESYSGPVIFQDQAAAEVFGQLFAPNLVTQRKQITEFGGQGDERFTAFQSKIGGRVLPEFIDVFAMPGIDKYSQTKLIGHFKIDDDGVNPQKVHLVEGGYLKNLLSGRVPTRRVRSTNGHNRSGAAMLSNIVVSADDSHLKSYEEMRDRMMELCKMRELPYGLVVRKVMNLNIMSTTLYGATMGLFEFPSGAGKYLPVEIYKVYPDGREELIRGGEGAGFSAQSFKDILSVGKDPYVMNYLAPAVISSYMTGGDP